MKKLLLLLLSSCLSNCEDYFSGESENQEVVQEMIQKEDDILSTESEMGDEEFFKMLSDLESIDIDNDFENNEQNKIHDDSVSMQVEEEL